MRLHQLTFICLLSVPLFSAAEITNCNGVWTTEPCAGQVNGQLPEKEYTPPEEGKLSGSRKDEMIHALTSAQINLRKRFKEVVDIADVRDLCEKPDTSADTCREAVTKRRDEIAERQLVLQKLENAKDEPDDGQSTGDENITVIQDNRIIVGITGTPTPVIPPIFRDPNAIPTGNPGLGVRPPPIPRRRR